MRVAGVDRGDGKCTIDSRDLEGRVAVIILNTPAMRCYLGAIRSVHADMCRTSGFSAYALSGYDSEVPAVIGRDDVAVARIATRDCGFWSATWALEYYSRGRDKQARPSAVSAGTEPDEQNLPG